MKRSSGVHRFLSRPAVLSRQTRDTTHGIWYNRAVASQTTLLVSSEVTHNNMQTKLIQRRVTRYYDSDCRAVDGRGDRAGGSTRRATRSPCGTAARAARTQSHPRINNLPCNFLSPLCELCPTSPGVFFDSLTLLCRLRRAGVALHNLLH